MAFHISFADGEVCDKCKKVGSGLLTISTTGRYPEERNFIFVHELCLLRSIENARKRAEKEVENKAKVG